MTKKEYLHTSAERDKEGRWHSLEPHTPGACIGFKGASCPKAPNSPCNHNHRTADAALECSRQREPFR